MDAVASRHVVGEIKHCGNLSEFLLKRLLYRHSNMGDSSDSDAEEDSKLREALDSETMTDNLYSKHSASDKDSVVSNGKSINLPSGESKQVGRASQHIRRPCGPSLRRDKQLEEEIKSDLQVHHPVSWELKGLFLQVTPAFQKFVASKLDNLLELEDVEVVESTAASIALAESNSCLGVRLTKRSKVEVLNASEAEQGLSSPRKRPALLSHKDPQVLLSVSCIAWREICCSK